MHWINQRLEKFSHAVTQWAGSSWAFGIAFALIVVWATTGPLFNFSETWQLVINTGTTIVTFLMVFLIQRSQNKEALVIQVKLNELLAAQQGASNELINVEDMSEEQVENLHHRFAELSHHLEMVSDGRSAHSIAEAQGALQEFHQSLRAPSDKRRRKANPRRHRSKPR
jgi:low affinity Fe/Cu permease